MASGRPTFFLTSYSYSYPLFSYSHANGFPASELRLCAVSGSASFDHSFSQYSHFFFHLPRLRGHACSHGLPLGSHGPPTYFTSQKEKRKTYLLPLGYVTPKRRTALNSYKKT